MGLSYRDSGVNIEDGGLLVDRIKPMAKRTLRPGVMGGLGGFGALFEIPMDRYRHPVLVSGTDGVGTKLKLAIETNEHDTIGIDLVAMCANDVLVSGAEPLFFLDYYASGKLDVDVAASVICGIAEGCEQAGMSLVGGETAEMPGMYADGDYDLAGFCVGIVEKDRIINGSKVMSGDVLIGLASSGPHSNGYSLIRKIMEVEDRELDAKKLLVPTRIYVKSIMGLLERADINAMAHITGGGLTENIPRVLPVNTKAIIDINSWKRPEIFNTIQRVGEVSEKEMLRTFNCGIGMVICIKNDIKDYVLGLLRDYGEEAQVIGSIAEWHGEPFVEYLQ